MFALVAKLTEIDGSPMADEDMLEMDLQSVLSLAAEAVGNPTLPLALSSHISVACGTTDKAEQNCLNR
jgi:hypothetical protein